MYFKKLAYNELELQNTPELASTIHGDLFSFNRNNYIQWITKVIINRKNQLKIIVLDHVDTKNQKKR